VSKREETATSASVLTQHNDRLRTGANLEETVLTPATVKSGAFGLRYRGKVKGQIYAQPLYVPNIEIPDRGPKNVVIVADMENYIYCFDADASSSVVDPLLWKTLQLGTPVPHGEVGGKGYSDIDGNIGILSTPVISKSGFVYLVYFYKVGADFQYALSKISVDSGALVNVVTISAETHGVAGKIKFDPRFQSQRPGLLLSTDEKTIIIAFASFGDTNPYHGWIMSYDTETLLQKKVFNTTPNGSRGGVWMSGQGVSSDDKDNLYFVTGNASFQDTPNIFNKTTVNGASTKFAPALCASSDVMIVAWVVDGGQVSYCWRSTKTYFSPPLDGPAVKNSDISLCYDSTTNRAFLAWKDTSETLSVMQSYPLGPNNPDPFSSGAVRKDYGHLPIGNFGTSIAVFGGAIYAAYIEGGLVAIQKIDPETLHVVGGRLLVGKGYVATTSPALFATTDRLYCLWSGGTGGQNNINMAWSTDGQLTNSPIAGYGEYSSDRSCLIDYQGTHVLAWRGTSSHGPINFRAGWAPPGRVPGLRLPAKWTSSVEWANAGLAMTTFEGKLYLAWGGTDCALNIAQVSVQPELGDSIVKLDANLNLMDWFSPYDTENLNDHDVDLGSGGVLVLPSDITGAKKIAISGGKQGKLYVVDRDNLGRNVPKETGYDPQVLQSFQAAGVQYETTGQNAPPTASSAGGYHNIHGTPVVWNGPDDVYVYLWAEDDWLRVYRYDKATQRLSVEPVQMSAVDVITPAASMPGAALSLSANGNTRGTAILWASHPLSDDANQATVKGILRAFDAENVLKPIWDTQSANVDFYYYAKFAPPTIAGGRVFLGTFDATMPDKNKEGHLLVFGLA
jgi:hypothetical protein